MERSIGEKLLANSRHQMPNMLACQTVDDFSSHLWIFLLQDKYHKRIIWCSCLVILIVADKINVLFLAHPSSLGVICYVVKYETTW